MAAVSPSADAFLYHVIDFRGSFFVPAPSSQHTNQENKVSLAKLAGREVPRITCLQSYKQRGHG